MHDVCRQADLADEAKQVADRDRDVEVVRAALGNVRHQIVGEAGRHKAHDAGGLPEGVGDIPRGTVDDKDEINRGAAGERGRSVDAEGCEVAHRRPWRNARVEGGRLHHGHTRRECGENAGNSGNCGDGVIAHEQIEFIAFIDIDDAIEIATGEIAGNQDGQWSRNELERGQRHDDAPPGVPVETRCLDVEGAIGQGETNLLRGGPWIVGLKKCGNGPGMRSGSRSSKERIESRHSCLHPIRSGYIRLGPEDSAAGEEVPRSVGIALRIVEHAARTIRAKGLHRIGSAAHERVGECRCHIDGRDRKRVCGSGMAPHKTVGRNRQFTGEAFEMQEARFARDADNNHLPPLQGRSQPLKRILGSILSGGGTTQNAASSVKEEQVVVVGGATKDIRPEQQGKRPGASGWNDVADGVAIAVRNTCAVA